MYDAEGLRAFFENRRFVELIDFMAKRYGKLPHEVLNDSTIFEFNFDVAVFIVGLKAEAPQPQAATHTDWVKHGFKRTVKKKPKG